MKRASIVFVGLVVIVFMAVYPGLAQKAPAPEQETPKQEMTGCKQLNLTPEQQEKMQKLCLGFQKEMLTLRTAVQAQMLDLQKLILEKADTNAINNAIDAMAKARAEIQKKAFAHRLEIGKILTEEQKKIFDQQRCGMGMHGMGCFGPGMRMHGMGCGGGCHMMRMRGMGCGMGMPGKGCTQGCGQSCGKVEKKVCCQKEPAACEGCKH